MRPTKGESSSASGKYQLRRRLAVALGLFVAMIVLLGAGSVVAALGHHRAMHHARHYQEAARRAGVLSILAREQYIHEAHTIIAGDASHVGHHHSWAAKLQEEATALRAELGHEGSVAIDDIATKSNELARVFSEDIVPAVQRNDASAVRAAHERATALVDQITGRADQLAKDYVARAEQANHSADHEATAMVVGAGLACALAPLLAFVVARRLWRDFEVPLARLRRVAERVTGGDRRARVEQLPAAELAVVGATFDSMLDALDRAEADLLAAERLAAVGRIAAGVAHEINNPIAVIRGYVKMMLEEKTGEAELNELRIVDEEAAICQRIADDLLAYARAPAIALERVDAAPLLEDAVERLKTSVRELGSDVHVRAEARAITVDPGRVRQVVTNLVRNACEANGRSKSTEPVEVIGTCSDRDRYRIAILDRGPGVPPEDHDRLFEPFFTTRGEGAGLGLAVCFGLVTAHGGEIRVESRPGGGSIFTVDLPLAGRSEPGGESVS